MTHINGFESTPRSRISFYDGDREFEGSNCLSCEDDLQRSTKRDIQTLVRSPWFRQMFEETLFPTEERSVTTVHVRMEYDAEKGSKRVVVFLPKGDGSSDIYEAEVGKGELYENPAVDQHITQTIQKVNDFYFNCPHRGAERLGRNNGMNPLMPQNLRGINGINDDSSSSSRSAKDSSNNSEDELLSCVSEDSSSNSEDELLSCVSDEETSSSNNESIDNKSLNSRSSRRFNPRRIIPSNTSRFASYRRLTRKSNPESGALRRLGLLHKEELAFTKQSYDRRIGVLEDEIAGLTTLLDQRAQAGFPPSETDIRLSTTITAASQELSVLKTDSVTDLSVSPESVQSIHQEDSNSTSAQLEELKSKIEQLESQLKDAIDINFSNVTENETTARLNLEEECFSYYGKIKHYNSSLGMQQQIEKKTARIQELEQQQQTLERDLNQEKGLKLEAQKECGETKCLETEQTGRAKLEESQEAERLQLTTIRFTDKISQLQTQQDELTAQLTTLRKTSEEEEERERVKNDEQFGRIAEEKEKSDEMTVLLQEERKKLINITEKLKDQHENNLRDQHVEHNRILEQRLLNAQTEYSTLMAQAEKDHAEEIQSLQALRTEEKKPLENRILELTDNVKMATTDKEFAQAEMQELQTKLSLTREMIQALQNTITTTETKIALLQTTSDLTRELLVPLKTTMEIIERTPDIDYNLIDSLIMKHEDLIKQNQKSEQLILDLTHEKETAQQNTRLLQTQIEKLTETNNSLELTRTKQTEQLEQQRIHTINQEALLRRNQELETTISAISADKQTLIDLQGLQSQMTTELDSLRAQSKKDTESIIELGNLLEQKTVELDLITSQFTKSSEELEGRINLLQEETRELRTKLSKTTALMTLEDPNISTPLNNPVTEAAPIRDQNDSEDSELAGRLELERLLKSKKASSISNKDATVICEVLAHFKKESYTLPPQPRGTQSSGPKKGAIRIILAAEAQARHLLTKQQSQVQTTTDKHFSQLEAKTWSVEYNAARGNMGLNQSNVKNPNSTSHRETRQQFLLKIEENSNLDAYINTFDSTKAITLAQLYIIENDILNRLIEQIDLLEGEKIRQMGGLSPNAYATACDYITRRQPLIQSCKNMIRRQQERLKTLNPLTDKDAYDQCVTLIQEQNDLMRRTTIPNQATIEHIQRLEESIAEHNKEKMKIEKGRNCSLNIITALHTILSQKSGETTPDGPPLSRFSSP